MSFIANIHYSCVKVAKISDIAKESVKIECLNYQIDTKCITGESFLARALCVYIRSSVEDVYFVVLFLYYF